MAKIQLEYFGERLGQMLAEAGTYGENGAHGSGNYGLSGALEGGGDVAGQAEEPTLERDASIDVPLARVNYDPSLIAPADMVAVAHATAMTHLDASQIASLAREVAMFGDTFGMQVRRSYGLSDDAFDLIKRTPVFINTFKKTQTDLVDNDAMPVQLMATKMLLGNLPVLNRMARSNIAEPRDRLKAIDIMKDLAGTVRPKSAGKSVHSAVNINFGNSLGNNLAKTITIDVEQ